jgi:medium-chain acyl-[acyl-carrier-protein] hydrolase
MEPFFQLTFPIPPDDIDFAGRLRASAFFRYIQNTAALHAEGLQLGYQDLQAAGLFWVLSWVKIEVLAYPHYRDSLTVSTWPFDRYRLFSLRDFHFTGQNGQIFGRGRTAWLLVDAAAKRVANLDRLPRPVPYLTGQPAMQSLPQKVALPQSPETLYEKQVGYTDLDINQHVNNARYVEYLLDGYPLDFHRSHQLRALAFSFVSEARYGDRLILARQAAWDEHGADQVIARQAHDDKLVFQALVEWD